jgi:hypothetical protein
LFVGIGLLVKTFWSHQSKVIVNNFCELHKIKLFGD